MAKKLYVGNLSYSTTEESLNALFAQFGEVVSAVVIKDRATGQSKGFGFIEMDTDIMGERAIGGMNGKPLDDRRIRVSAAVDKPRRFGDSRKSFENDGERPRRRFGDGERRSFRDGDRKPFRENRERNFSRDRDESRSRRFRDEKPAAEEF